MPIRLLLCLFILLPLSIHAQPLLFRAGANVGVSPEQTLGFHAGIAGRMNINERIFLQPELIYLNSHDKQDNARFSYNYLFMPLTFNFEQDQFRMLVGAQIGSLIEASSKDLAKDTKNYINGSLKPFDLALVAGFSIDLAERMILDFRYTHGITNTTNNLRAANNKSFNQMILLSILCPLTK